MAITRLSGVAFLLMPRHCCFAANRRLYNFGQRPADLAFGTLEQIRSLAAHAHWPHPEGIEVESQTNEGALRPTTVTLPVNGIFRLTDDMWVGNANASQSARLEIAPMGDESVREHSQPEGTSQPAGKMLTEQAKSTSEGLRPLEVLYG